VIIDEAQRIKNAKSKQSQAVKALKYMRSWALTGTPLENSTDDVVSIFEYVKPGTIDEADSQQKVRSQIKPYMLRRRQKEVLKELPKLIPDDVEIDITESQRDTYNRAEREGVLELNGKGDTITITHVFALINQLRQICNFDPATGESSKADYVVECMEEIIENERKALIFGYFVQEPYGLKKLARVLAGTTVFNSRITPLELHGEISQSQRDATVDKFQNDPMYPVVLSNYAVGGVGHNLHAANYVILFDRWWNPSVEDQAIKRAHRLGQKLPVIVKRLYCKDTVEERILKKLSGKRKTFANVNDGIDDKPNQDAMGLSEEEIFSLFNISVRPKSRKHEGARPENILDNMDPHEYETLVAQIYEHEGYSVNTTGKTRDGGVDIYAERIVAGGRDRIVIQCKRQKDNVGRPILQQQWGIVNSDNTITRCDIVTSAYFTSDAKNFADGRRMTLIDRDKLVQLINKYRIATIVS
jgi:SNF2 family DNA or RNA helicase